jgi:hypothetical protein
MARKDMERSTESVGVVVVLVAALFLVVVVLGGCVPLDPARLAFGCEVVNETVKTHSVPLQDAHLRYGTIDTGTVRTGPTGGHDAGIIYRPDTAVPVEHTSDAPCASEDSPLVRPEEAGMATK